MPNGSPLPAAAIANPHTDNTSRMMSAICRSFFVSWAIIGRSPFQETGRRQLKHHDVPRPDGGLGAVGADYPFPAIRPDGVFWVLWFAGFSGTVQISAEFVSRASFYGSLVAVYAISDR